MFGIGIGSSSTHGLERVLAGFALVGLIAVFAVDNGGEDRTQHRHSRCGRARVAVVAPPAITSPSNAREAADLAYRVREFDRAAQLIAGIRPSDADLQSLALQYERLGRAFAIGMDPWSYMIESFEALREASKLDIVLGGAHTDMLQARMRRVAPRAALGYMQVQDYANAELARHTAEVLGVSAEELAVIGEAIATHDGGP